MTALHRGLQFTSASRPRRITYGQNLFRYETAPWNLVGLKRAFITGFMPASSVKEFVSGIMTLLPEQEALPRTPGAQGFAFYALNTARFTRPMLRQPQEDQAFVVWLFRSVSANDAPALARLQQSNRELLARMTALGGKRYSPYSGIMSTGDWAAHFGPDVWRRLSAAKKKYDPKNVLSPGPGIFGAATD